ncbi:sugar phosphate isomerase/epimerase family protein [Pedosphaera parvula]|uniref:Xylose isomerase domain protein TIM barrel n=1 Tax=Pedosphaera parvula (strain Ellin514) TaxID=320771 RepID=B9XCU3_PEDPL|nr:sugar phosphate isomerase/epimerase [Pedosphaera parvula]EEF62289.1 Xylose isomerase domain protein TIM barrel [Pedosphaera parvula Ellin514]
MNRRQFIRTAAVATTAAATLKFSTAEAAEAKGTNWPIGCFNRPWVGDNMTYETALIGVKAAGYKLTGLLTTTKEDPFIKAEATPEYLAALKEKIAAHGLKANMGALRLKNELSVEDSIKDVRKQIDNAKFLGLDFILTFGVDSPKYYENYYKVMADAAPYSQEHGMKLVLKPHGGGSGASEEIIRCMDKVKQPNFKIWYDAGNIIYYTGKDPLEQLKPIAEHVTGFCAKDCDKEKGDVWLEFGTGKVDFRAVFSELKRAGFNGPVMVECCKKGKTVEEATEGARKNRLYLEKLFASL